MRGNRHRSGNLIPPAVVPVIDRNVVASSMRENLDSADGRILSRREIFRNSIIFENPNDAVRSMRLRIGEWLFSRLPVRMGGSGRIPVPVLRSSVCSRVPGPPDAHCDAATSLAATCRQEPRSASAGLSRAAFAFGNVGKLVRAELGPLILSENASKHGQ